MTGYSLPTGEEPHVFDDAWRDGGVPTAAGGQGGYIAGAIGAGGGLLARRARRAEYALY